MSIPKEHSTFAHRTAIEKLVKETRLEVAGIEYVVNNKGEWFIYDINALSILRSSFKEEYGIDGWGLLADSAVIAIGTILHHAFNPSTTTAAPNILIFVIGNNHVVIHEESLITLN